mgnify:FL=1
MVSAVFHSPLDARTEPLLADTPATPRARNRTAVAASTATPKEPAVNTASTVTPRAPIDWRAFWLRVLPPVLGIGLLLAIWQLVAMHSTNGFPSPATTMTQAISVFSDPFYSKGPNDQGVGWNVLSSLKRVAMGFGLAALVGIPLGFMIGRFTFLNRMFNPLISLLRPVSPLAWLPIGLLVFKGANPAAIWTIFICSIWPMIINTAVGVQRVPSDYMNVARVLKIGRAHV